MGTDASRVAGVRPASGGARDNGAAGTSVPVPGDAARSKGAGSPRIEPALERELTAGPWDYPWELAPGVSAPVADPGARHAAWTLERMLEEPVKRALAVAGRGPGVLVVGAAEGRLAHAALGWGAGRVVALESDPVRRRRAELIADHYGLASRGLRVRGGEPGAVLRAAANDRFAAVVLLRLDELGGELGDLLPAGAAAVRPGGVLALEAGSAARPRLAEGVSKAGLERVRRAWPPLEGERRYVVGERLVLVAAVTPSAASA
jgi:hypothetical protein